jgi:iron complex transport system ATP-binding protein
MLSVENLGCKYDRWIFRNLNFELKPSSFTTLLGANGRGKSSLMRIMAGAQSADEGNITSNCQIGYVPQSTDLIFNQSVLEMVVLGRANKIGLLATPKKSDYAMAEQALEKLNILHLAHQDFHELSGGQKQLVFMARALASEADLLILDEPTVALDWHNQSLILNTLKSLAVDEGYTVFLSTHNPQHSFDFADASLLMFPDDDYAFGRPVNIMTEQALSALYQVPVKQAKFNNTYYAFPVFTQRKEK